MSSIRSILGFCFMLLSLLALAATAQAHSCTTRHDLALALLSEENAPLAPAFISPEATQRTSVTARLIDEMAENLLLVARHEPRLVKIEPGLGGESFTMPLIPEHYGERPMGRLLIAGHPHTSHLLLDYFLHAQDYAFAQPTVLFISPEERMADRYELGKMMFCKYYNTKPRHWYERDHAHERQTLATYNRQNAVAQRHLRTAPRIERRRRGAPSSRLCMLGLSWQRQG